MAGVGWMTCGPGKWTTRKSSPMTLQWVSGMPVPSGSPMPCPVPGNQPGRFGLRSVVGNQAGMAP